MHERARRPVHLLPALGVLLLAALLAAGCGGNDGGDDDGTSSSSVDEPVEVRDPTAPEPDEDLLEELGADGTVLTEAGCTVGSFEEQEADHVDVGDDLESNSFPPTSGRHYEDWAPFGLYEDPLDDGHVVHNLEHGGVAVWLGNEVDDAQADAIAELLDDEEKWIVAPRRDLDGLVSTAWTKALACSPTALAKLEPEPLADALDTWYEVVVSTGSEAEKDVPAYAGAMNDPAPERDISADSPF